MSRLTFGPARKECPHPLWGLRGSLRCERYPGAAGGRRCAGGRRQPEGRGFFGDCRERSFGFLPSAGCGLAEEGLEMRIGIASHHGGFALKSEIAAKLRSSGHEVIDFGAQALDLADDYPDFVMPLARALAAGEIERGVALCGSGVGA